MQIRRPHRPTIGVLAGWQLYGALTAHNYLDSIFRGIRTAARDRGCNLLLACGMSLSTDAPYTHFRPAWPEPASDADFVPVGPWNTDGLIIVNPLLLEARSRYVQQIMETGHPVVFVGDAEGGPAVTVDNAGGIRQALAHLLAHGHTHIAFIAGTAEDARGDSGKRLRAYRSFVRKHGLSDDPRLVAYGDHFLQGGQQAMQQILRSGIPFTAVLASNDESAIGAIQTLQEHGLRVPEDKAVIGFDDWYEASAQQPALTTVHSPTFERGYQAVNLLLAYLQGHKTDVDIINTRTHLVLRQSCGCRPNQMLTNALQPDEIDGNGVKHHTSTAQLPRVITQVVLAEARRLSQSEVLMLAQRLVEAFTTSLEQANASPFQVAVTNILHVVETAEEDAHVWQQAVLALERSLPQFLPPENQEAYHAAQTMLRQAQTSISESVRRRYRSSIANQNFITNQVGFLNARLLTAVDKTQLFTILGEYLPEVGIHEAGVVFLTPADHDRVAQSILYPLFVTNERSVQFASRSFPPPLLQRDDRPFSLALLPLVGQEQQTGYVVFEASNLDLCAIIVRQLVAALKSVQLYREATEGRRLAEEANRMKSRFLSTVSHELRTPLTLIVGLSHILLQEVAGNHLLPEAQLQNVKWIHASAQHLDGLIRDVLDLARSEVDQLKLVQEPLNLAEVLQPVSAIGEQLAQGKGLVWRVHTPETLPIVWGDRTRLRQVVLNLVSNAVKFTGHGEVSLSVHTDGHQVQIIVSDTGLGIPLAEQAAIFDEFRQSERTTARGYGGLGLGLAICKRLVELHGGKISVVSSGEEESGSTFLLTLPIMLDQVEGAQPTITGRPSTHILLLVEQIEAGERLQAHLHRQGFMVQVKQVDEQAEWLSALLQTPPEAVVLDSGMAANLGWEILKILKGKPATQDIPVLFFTLAADQDIGAILSLDYLTKPVGTAELAEALRRQGLDAGLEQERHILIVDDDPGILAMHTQIVASQGGQFQVLQARNGREALVVMRRKRPHLILLDLMMPELDGFGVIEAMQKDPTLCDIPVIVLTSQVLTEEDMARLNQGVSKVLQKGVFSVQETLAHIELVLERNQKLSSDTRRLVRKAMAYIHEHYTSAISRDDIAGYASVSRSYLSTCFQQELGVSPITYLNRYRVNQAKILLQTTQRTIADIAITVGFSDHSHFSRIFRREVGMSPRQFRHT